MAQLTWFCVINGAIHYIVVDGCTSENRIENRIMFTRFCANEDDVISQSNNGYTFEFVHSTAMEILIADRAMSYAIREISDNMEEEVENEGLRNRYNNAVNKRKFVKFQARMIVSPYFDFTRSYMKTGEDTDICILLERLKNQIIEQMKKELG